MKIYRMGLDTLTRRYSGMSLTSAKDAKELLDDAIKNGRHFWQVELYVRQCIQEWTKQKDIL